MRSGGVCARIDPGGARPESMVWLKRIAVAAGLGALAAAAAPAALAHAGERGFILLLPTGLFQAGGTLAVAVSFLVVIWIRASALRRTFERARRTLFPVPRSHFGCNVAASAVLVVLVAAGLEGSRDPLANPLPLSVWTLMWVGLTFAHAVLGYLWPIVNPWTALARLVRRILGRTGDHDAGLLDWPEALGPGRPSPCCCSSPGSSSSIPPRRIPRSWASPSPGTRSSRWSAWCCSGTGRGSATSRSSRGSSAS